MKDWQYWLQLKEIRRLGMDKEERKQFDKECNDMGWVMAVAFGIMAVVFVGALILGTVVLGGR